MTEENKTWEHDNEQVSLSKMASSFYKAQLGINSIRDELKLVNDNLDRIAKALENGK